MAVAGALSVCLTATALADNPAYKRPVLPDVYQGNGVYVEIEPIVIQSDENWKSYNSILGDGLLKVGTEMKSTEKDPDGYTKPGKERYTAYVNTKGEFVIPPTKGTATFDFGNFHDGRAWFKDQTANPWKFGYIDTSGNVVIPAQFSEAADFHEGVACVDGKIINTSGKVVAEGFKGFRDSTRASGGMIRYTGNLPNGDYFVGYLNLQGQPAVTIFRGSYYDYYDQKAELLEPVSDFHDGYAVAKEQKPGRLYPTYVILNQAGAEVSRLKDTPPYRMEPISYGTVVGDGTVAMSRINTESGSSTQRLVDLKGNTVMEAGISRDVYLKDGVIPGGTDRDGFAALLLDKSGQAVMPRELFADSTGMIDFTELERFFRHHPEYNRNDRLTWNFQNGEGVFRGGVESGSTILSLELADPNSISGECKASWAWTVSVHPGTYTGSGVVWSKNAKVYPDQTTPAKEKTMVPESGDSWLASDRHTSTSKAMGIDHKQHTVYHYAPGTAFQLQTEMGNATDVAIYLDYDKKGKFEPWKWNIFDTGMYGVNGSAKFNEDGWLLLPAGRLVTMDGAYVCVDSAQTPPPKPKPDPKPVKPSNEPSGWAKDQVSEATAAGIVPTSLQSKYNVGITRAEFCALACQTYETLHGPITGYEQMHFNDTADVNVLKMASIGVVNGVKPDQFAPNDGLTREQAATMLARLAKAAGSPLAEAAPSFADNKSISSWAKDAVGQMQKSGVMGGTGNNQFTPKGTYTREQSILTALRLYNILK